jgi:hypothetical protein
LIQEGLTLDSVELLTFLCGWCRDEVRDARGTICLLSLCLGGGQSSSHNNQIPRQKKSPNIQVEFAGLYCI